MPRKPTQRNWPRSSRTYCLAHQRPCSTQRRLWRGSDRQRLQVHLNIQPVVPLSIGKDWNLIGRTILPIISQHDVFYDPILPVTQNCNQDGLSDTMQSFFFSPKAPGLGGLIWGVGPALLYPTATHPLLGSQWGELPVNTVWVNPSCTWPLRSGHGPPDSNGLTPLITITEAFAANVRGLGAFLIGKSILGTIYHILGAGGAA
jgi:hypothetical protein